MERKRETPTSVPGTICVSSSCSSWWSVCDDILASRPRPWFSKMRWPYVFIIVHLHLRRRQRTINSHAATRRGMLLMMSESRI